MKACWHRGDLCAGRHTDAKRGRVRGRLSLPHPLHPSTKAHHLYSLPYLRVFTHSSRSLSLSFQFCLWLDEGGGGRKERVETSPPPPPPHSIVTQSHLSSPLLPSLSLLSCIFPCHFYSSLLSLRATTPFRQQSGLAPPPFRPDYA